MRIELRGTERRLESVVKKLAFAKVEEGRVVIPSALDSSLPLNDHLVWLWGFLKVERRFLKGLAADGVKLVCIAQCPRGRVSLKPNGAEMLHVLEMDLQIETK